MSVAAGTVVGWLVSWWTKKTERHHTNPPQPRTYGQRAGNLMQFGETWIDMSRVVAIEFNPVEGCCKIQFHGAVQLWRVPMEDAECIKGFLGNISELRETEDPQWEMGKVRSDGERTI